MASHVQADAEGAISILRAQDFDDLILDVPHARIWADEVATAIRALFPGAGTDCSADCSAAAAASASSPPKDTNSIPALAVDGNEA